MTDPSAESAAETTKHPNRGAVKYAVGFALFGVCLLLWARVTASSLEVAYVPISADGDPSSRIRFTSPQSSTYEVELELQAKDDFDRMDAIYGTTEEIPELNLRWVISTGEETVAQGTSQQYLYVSTDWYKQRLVKWILGARQYHNIRNSRIGRGIGKFQGQKDTEYELTASVEAWPNDPPFVDPHLVVLIDRRSRARELGRVKGLAVAGIASLTVAGVVLLLTALRKRGR